MTIWSDWATALSDNAANFRRNAFAIFTMSHQNINLCKNIKFTSAYGNFKKKNKRGNNKYGQVGKSIRFDACRWFHRLFRDQWLQCAALAAISGAGLVRAGNHVLLFRRLSRRNDVLRREDREHGSPRILPGHTRPGGTSSCPRIGCRQDCRVRRRHALADASYHRRGPQPAGASAHDERANDLHLVVVAACACPDGARRPRAYVGTSFDFRLHPLALTCAVPGWRMPALLYVRNDTN